MNFFSGDGWPMHTLFIKSIVITPKGSAPSIRLFNSLLHYLQQHCPRRRVFKLSYLALFAIIFTFIMGPPPKHLPLQRAVAQILTHQQLKNKLCTAERLCPIINALAGSIDDESIATVDPPLIKKAFKDMDNTEYFTPCKKSNNELINLNINHVEGDRSSVIGKSSYLSAMWQV